jgi:hypothetical protein
VGFASAIVHEIPRGTVNQSQTLAAYRRKIGGILVAIYPTGERPGFATQRD